MEKKNVQQIIIFVICAIILAYFFSLTVKEEVDPTPDVYYKNEDPLLKKIRDAELAKVQKLTDTVSFIYFDIGSSIIKDSSAILYVAKNNLAPDVFVKGFTDNSGTEITNIKLSNKRANNVCALLAQYKTLGSISGEGYGPSNPQAPNDVEVNMQLNRRTEIYWKKKYVTEEKTN